MIINKLVPFFFLFFIYQKLSAQPNASIQIQYNSSHPYNSFRPSELLGAAFDGHPKGDMDRIFKAENIRAMRSVGLKPLSYRLRTELAGEVWHWNPVGHWSNLKKQEGYWISDSVPTSFISVSNGYRLPRRGNTHDQANDDDYSRIDDGDTTTFWKSNPYLDQSYTGDNDSLHAQWIVIDLGINKSINAITISWGNPYALAFKVDYAFDIGADYFEPYTPGLWRSFIKGSVQNQKPDNRIIKLSEKLVNARFIRISFYKSSYTTDDTSDKRNSVGFSIKEVQVGYIDKQNVFHDWVKHIPHNKKQTVIHVSSTDPWHRSIDIDANTEQAGVDRFYMSGLYDNSSSVMMPFALLYDTPENMMALLHYLKQRRYKVNELEMGEEPEGQLIHPNDYAALYRQSSLQVRKRYPEIKMGGPGFAALDFTESDDYTFSERQWTEIFLANLKSHHCLDHFNFFSTEWYPFDNICAPPSPQLKIQPSMLQIALRPFIKNILPPHTPIYLTEYGYSAYAGRPEVEIEGALMYADIVASFLTLGGNKSFLYGYEPTFLDQTNHCDWGNNMIFGMDDSGTIQYHTAAYYSMQMITKQWATPSDSLLKVFKVNVLTGNSDSLSLSAYAILKPDHKWSILIINKDSSRSFTGKVSVHNFQNHDIRFIKSMHVWQYSGKQYQWLNNGGDGHPIKNLPPKEFDLKNNKKLVLPPFSMTVVEE
jgi:F5/8 type C domain.